MRWPLLFGAAALLAGFAPFATAQLPLPNLPTSGQPSLTAPDQNVKTTTPPAATVPVSVPAASLAPPVRRQPPEEPDTPRPAPRLPPVESTTPRPATTTAERETPQLAAAAP